MANLKVGLEPIVYGDRAEVDLPGFLAEAAEMGYAGVEGTAAFRMTPIEEVKALLAQYNLACPIMHVHYGDFTDMAKLETNIAFLKAVGGKYLCCSGVAPGEGIEQFTEAAKTFTKAGEICRQHGLMMCYHNHASEFRVYDGKVGMDTLFGETDPENLKACVDVYWVHIGGQDPADFITRYRERIPILHFKDGAPRKFTELGRGEVDLPGALKAAMTTPADWIIYEQDSTDLTPKESSTISLAYLKSLGL
jgi:sugar phosphate isomerase/epimerase